MSRRGLPTVAVFDAALPPGLAFARSLGRRDVPTIVFGHRPDVMTRRSRFVDAFEECPTVLWSDEFTEWLVDRLGRGDIDLVAPTSDYVAFNAAEAATHPSIDRDLGLPPIDGLLDCLFKDRFAHALDRVGFPGPHTLAPTSAAEAIDAVEAVGLPVVAKPRSHVGVGVHRGDVVRDLDEAERVFTPHEVDEHSRGALRHDPELGWPLVQEYVERRGLEVISITGYLARDGAVHGVGHSRKTHQWPPGLGIGIRFETADAQPFTDAAIDAARQILGHGIFEIEVLFDPSTGDHWAIDLNPRTYGQVALDIGRGNDLPAMWLRDVATVVVPDPRPSRRTPTSWTTGIPLYTGLAVRTVLGPDRVAAVRGALRYAVEPTVGASFQLDDPRPSLSFAKAVLRHPGGLVRPFLAEPADI